MAVRTSEATWEGALREGHGVVKLGSGLLQAPFSYTSRFEQGAGTNPEELLGAAYAGCFSMALASRLGRAGFTPQHIHTSAEVTVELVEGHHQITHIALYTEVATAGLDEAALLAHAEVVRGGCPVGRVLAGVPITLAARLLT